MPLKKGINEIDRYLATGNADVNLGFETFVRLIGKTFDKDVPLKKSCRKTCWKKVKKVKSWVTMGIRHSVKVRDKLFK